MEVRLSPSARLLPELLDAVELLRASALASRPELETLSAALEGGLLVAPCDVAQELLRVAIDEAGERVAAESTRLLRGEGSVAELRACMTRLDGLLDVLDVVA